MTRLCAGRGVQVDAGRKRLVDERGHERLFHGVNVVSKQAPYLPRTDRFNAEDSLAASDIADLRAMGATVVRLLVAVRAAPVPVPQDNLSVSPSMTRIMSESRPSLSLTIWV